MRPLIKNRIVVKVGTSTLTHDGGTPNLERLDSLSRVLSEVHGLGFEVILVTSGAIAVGQSKLKLRSRPSELRYKQAAAAVGQCELMHLYDKFFGEKGRTVAQILLTCDDIDIIERRENLKNTFETLIEMGIIPIVNENDSVSPTEIESSQKIFGDNDMLSALVALMCGAKTLIILSDIDGLYESDPKINPDARLIPEVYDISDELRALAGGAGTERGTGGMATKLAAAELFMGFGGNMVIINGSRPEGIYDIVENRPRGTLFVGKLSGV